MNLARTLSPPIGNKYSISALIASFQARPATKESPPMIKPIVRSRNSPFSVLLSSLMRFSTGDIWYLYHKKNSYPTRTSTDSEFLLPRGDFRLRLPYLHFLLYCYFFPGLSLHSYFLSVLHLLYP